MVDDRAMNVRKATPSDAAPFCAIYNHYVANTIVTFEEEAVAATEMARRIENTAARFPWLVAEHEGNVVGYAYATDWSSRAAYRNSVEISIYLAPDAAGRGIGSRLCEALLGELKAMGVHTVIGGVALPNEASVALHEKFGFAKTAHFHEVGRKFGRWIDVAYWELILNRD